MTCLQYLNASLPEQLLGQVKHPELSQLFFTDHRSYAHVIQGCPRRGTHWNSLKIFHSELKAILSCITTAGGYVCVSGTFFFYGYSWHRTKSQCPRACCQAEPLYLLLGKLIFEKKYRISNLVKWNVIYRAEIIPGFFFNKCICFPNICSKSPLRTWVFISSSCILAILLRDLCHLYLSSIISILSFIFLFLYINIR